MILGRITDLSQDHLRPQHDEKVVTLLDAHVQAVIGTMKKRLSASKEIPLQVSGGREIGNSRGTVCVRSLAFPARSNLYVILGTSPLCVLGTIVMTTGRRGVEGQARPL